MSQLDLLGDLIKNEVWRSCAGWGGFYEVSSLGRVRSVARVSPHPNGALSIKPRLMRFETTCHGYFRVTLCRDGVRTKLLVHRLVAATFLPEGCQMPQVNHIDGNRQNNCIDNLEWCTGAMNMINAVERGMFHGRTNEKARRKLTPEKADQIKQMATRGVPYREISNQFGISIAVISSIKLGRSWGYPNGTQARAWVGV